jgi:uncharacterized protein (DUF1501 family)
MTAMDDRFAPHILDAASRLDDDPEFDDIYRALSSPLDDDGISRRGFLGGLLATGGAAVLAGGTLGAVAAAASTPLAADDTILVVVMLGGGNDGINTLVPVGDSRYAALRRNLSVASGAHAVGSGLALHPSLGRLAARYHQGKVAIVRGVGDPTLDRSHFSSMASWMAGTSGADRRTGWLGRYLDTVPGSAGGLRAVTADGQIPLHLVGATSQVSAIGDSVPFGAERTNGREQALFEAIRSFGAQPSGLGAYGDAVAGLNRSSIDRARSLGGLGEPPTDNAPLTRQLKMVAKLINLDVGVRVFGATLGSFDTHHNQRWMHANLLSDLDAAIDGFYRTLSPAWSGRVVIMTFSEFGRRAAESGSGTDHGTSSPLFVIGDRVRGGMVGRQPSLADLDSRGDLAVTTDFRSVYASILARWLRAEPRHILGAAYPELDLIASVPRKETSGPPMVPEKKFAPFRDAGAFVDQQYADFLGRLPSKKNRDSWIKRVRRGSTTLAMAIEEFYRASPYYAFGRQICRVHYCLTGRAPGYDDLLRWMRVREASGLRPVVAEIMATPAARDRYHREYSTKLVAHLHRDLTGEAPSSARSTAWTPKLNSNTEKGSVDFVVALATTPEAMRRFAYEANVCCVHAAMLRRAAPATTVTTWTNKLKAGTTVRSMMWDWFRVGEYRRRL